MMNKLLVIGLLLGFQLGYASDSGANAVNSRTAFTVGLVITVAGICVTTNALHELIAHSSRYHGTKKEIFDGIAVTLVGGMCMVHSFELAMLRREEVTPVGCCRGPENV